MKEQSIEKKLEYGVTEAKVRTCFRRDVEMTPWKAAERLKKMKAENFSIQFGKEEVVDNFDKSCFSGVVAMKICLEWFQRQERVTVNNFNFMVKGCQTWDSSFKLM